MKASVHLGFEVGSGRPVEIPIRNMVVCGQTQEAGKTTALEALITRAKIRAVTFVTKRGEGSFTNARRIAPYFREKTDWQSVSAILEASRGEKLKFERAWIIRASKGARTLADVQRNVRKAMETAKGLAGDVYLTLDAYLEMVVPAIASVRWASRLELAAGVNAVDLTIVPSELQHLVIRSSLDWVLEKEEDTIAVIPEAWKFVPQGRGTPVKLGAAALIRQGSGLHDYVWLDSQDIGGVEKEILRSCPVWLLGVQREANEIKRTLANIPAGVAKPSAADIATLEVGQFFACWGKHAVKTYVQPVWLPDTVAKAHAVTPGGAPLSMISPKSYPSSAPRAPQPQKEDRVNAAEADRLTKENEQLRAENQDLRRRIEALEHKTQPKPIPPVPRTLRDGDVPRQIQQLAGATPLDNDALYRELLARLVSDAAKDPVLLRVVASQPELKVIVKHQVIEADGDSLHGRIARLLADGFFDEGQTPSATIAELRKRGAGDDVKFNTGKELAALTSLGFLVRLGKTSDTRYEAVAGMKVNIVEAA